MQCKNQILNISQISFFKLFYPRFYIQVIFFYYTVSSQRPGGFKKARIVRAMVRGGRGGDGWQVVKNPAPEVHLEFPNSHTKVCMYVHTYACYTYICMYVVCMYVHIMYERVHINCPIIYKNKCFDWSLELYVTFCTFRIIITCKL